jgi:hypothetical protein
VISNKSQIRNARVNYWERSDETGSTAEARRAGIHIAPVAAINSSSGTIVNTSGSLGSRPNTVDRTAAATPSASAMPTSRPPHTDAAPDRSTISTTSRGRAPSASRIPISGQMRFDLLLQTAAPEHDRRLHFLVLRMPQHARDQPLPLQPLQRRIEGTVFDEQVVVWWIVNQRMRYPLFLRRDAMRSASVFSTLSRANCLSLASTSVHGAMVVLVLATISSTALV